MENKRQRHQQALKDFVRDLEEAGMLIRIGEEKRVDELPGLAEAHPSKALFVEKVKDCEFSFLTNAYCNQDQYAWALGCTRGEVGTTIARLAQQRLKPEIVEQAPCKEVILKGDSVDLTRFPLFLHHDRDGNAYLNDTAFISRDPDTGLSNWGIYRMMFRRRNETGVDLTCDTHRLHLHAKKAAAKGENLPVAVVIGGPILDKLASCTSVPHDVDDFDVLGPYYGAPARMVSCETVDLCVPANAEIVLEGHIMTSEGWVHDEGPYGEFTGMYGNGICHNNRVVISCMTYRRGGIYQQATIGGLHPWYADDMLLLPLLEGEIFDAIRRAGIDVLEVRADAGGLCQIAYARIRTRSGGDAKQTLAIILTCSRQAIPKIAMVFDEDVDIWDDNAVKWAMAFRYLPDRDTVILPQCNTLPLDPSICEDNTPPVYASKIGFDCTIPLVGNWNRRKFDRATVCTLGEPSADVKEMSEDEILSDMADFIHRSPRSWKEILERYHGQPYGKIYRSFGELRPKLGRTGDDPWFRYTFSDHDFAFEPGRDG
jgi:4-hydroxy-3-polyprenylbenzoate decarboxylase